MAQTPNFGKFIKEQQAVPQQVVNPQQVQQQQLVEVQGKDNTRPVPVQQDPFAMSQFSNTGIPDVPVNYGGGLAESLLNDNEVPEDIKKEFWQVFHKDNVLTFLDEERKKSKLLNFDIQKIDILNSIPYYDYDFRMELKFDILRNVFETKLDRALGFKTGNQKNERIVLQSQFSEQRHINEDGSRSMIKEGFFKRLMGRR